ncbi:uncharacterized protein LOC124357476 [Homalodisca vitripennis]|uniref:uncharacterized protein LOC124357476 n=1 Tax=Homalodisca vitripennis TaxID=197043 RepID=UPI001EE9F6A4|nr:uncharacterized protein LOC124357476 [Homalodisca vitripennis]KAG8246825.1 hypothetical protein J6590_076032 [Homalodisca vitripennis]
MVEPTKTYISNSDSSRELEALSAQLDNLVQEESSIRKTLEYVRIAKQRNKIEELEIKSKIMEVKNKLPRTRSQPKAVNNKASEVVQDSSVTLCDDPEIVNKTRLDLNVEYDYRYQYQEEEEESEESD